MSEYYELIHMKDYLTLGGSFRDHASVARRCRDNSSFANTYIHLAKLKYDYSISPLIQKEIRQEFSQQVFLNALEEREIVGSVRAYLEKGTAYIGRLMFKPDSQLWPFKKSFYLFSIFQPISFSLESVRPHSLHL
jgi:hypothetical protein